MAKYPYTATITAKVLNGDGSTSFTYQIKDGNGVLKDTRMYTVPAGGLLATAASEIKGIVRTQIFNDLAAADVAVGTVFSFNPMDVS